MQDNAIIAYESRKLKTHEQEYVVYDLELIVVIHALKMWRPYLLGKKFILVTNNIILKCFFSKLDLNSIQARWTIFLTEFEFDLHNIKGKDNKIFDSLSRHAHYLVGSSPSNIIKYFGE